MGEIISTKHFMDAYHARYNTPPPSFYHTTNLTLCGQAPSVSEMQLFLTKGYAWGESPWKKITYMIAPVSQHAVHEAFHELDMEFSHEINPVVDHYRRLIGKTKTYVGDFVDDRGRVAVEEVFDEIGQIRKVHFLRRRMRKVGKELYQKPELLSRRLSVEAIQ